MSSAPLICANIVMFGTYCAYLSRAALVLEWSVQSLLVMVPSLNGGATKVLTLKTGGEDVLHKWGLHHPVMEIICSAKVLNLLHGRDVFTT